MSEQQCWIVLILLALLLGYSIKRYVLNERNIKRGFDDHKPKHKRNNIGAKKIDERKK